MDIHHISHYGPGPLGSLRSAQPHLPAFIQSRGIGLVQGNHESARKKGLWRIGLVRGCSGMRQAKWGRWAASMILLS